MVEHALLICNGEPPSRTLARRLAARSNLIVAADGGANVARSLGLRPDVIVGDLDSITKASKKYFSTSGLIHITRQDNTDLEKALDLLLARKVKGVVLVAATGKRIDHTLGNLSVIWRYTHAMELVVCADHWVALPVRKMRRVRAHVGTLISLIPFGPCSGITLSGLQYSLNNAKMHVGEIGLSNVVVKSPFTVRVKKGNMLLIVHENLSAASLMPS